MTALTIILLSLAWGLAFLGIKVALEGFSPLGVATARHLIAIPFWLGVLWGRGKPCLPPPGQRLTYLGLGVLMVPVYHLALNAAQTRLDSGIAGLVVATAPLWVAVSDQTLFRRAVAPRCWQGGVVALAGVALAGGVVAAGAPLPSLALAFVAPLAAALYTGHAHDLVRRDGALPFTAWSIGMGTLPLLLYGALSPVGWWRAGAALPATPAILAVLGLGILSTFGGGLAFMALVRRHGGVVAAGWLFLIPVVAVLAGGLLGHEPLGTGQFAGMALVAAGVWWANRPGREAPTLSAKG